MKLVLSWDDGHPFDLRIAELLLKYNHSATFFLPIFNSEGREVMQNYDVRELDMLFELGSHTLNHSYLNEISIRSADTEIRTGKEHLENIVGHQINGFCYPGGKRNSEIEACVKNSGFYYARTTVNLMASIGVDKYNIPTSFQFYPHKKSTIVRNYVKHMSYISRNALFRKAMSTSRWLDVLESSVRESMGSDNIIHIWGHSWEIEALNLWDELEKFLSFAHSIGLHAISISDLFQETDFYGDA